MGNNYSPFSLKKGVPIQNGFDEYSFNIPKDVVFKCYVFNLASKEERTDYEALMTDFVRNRNQYFSIEIKNHNYETNVFAIVSFYIRKVNNQDIETDGIPFNQSMKHLLSSLSQEKK